MVTSLEHPMPANIPSMKNIVKASVGPSQSTSTVDNSVVNTLPWLQGSKLGSIGTIILRLSDETQNFLTKLVRMAVDGFNHHYIQAKPAGNQDNSPASTSSPQTTIAVPKPYCHPASDTVQMKPPPDISRAQLLSEGQYPIQLAGNNHDGYYSNNQLLTALVCACDSERHLLHLRCSEFEVEPSQSCIYDALYVNHQKHCGEVEPSFQPARCYNLTLRSDASRHGKLLCRIQVQERSVFPYK